ncbi:hypothetical protein ABVV53_00845 [Novosphingobium sp. RD2P27]|uniref:Uncharacterized protein n=1 Tax=Novosphingobium kalidii TaxID=3230299 RepID=A0ABV2CWP0_9SPHN
MALLQDAQPAPSVHLTSGIDATLMAQRCLDLIKRTSPAGYEFWFTSGPTVGAEDVALQDHADIIYSAHLLGVTQQLQAEAAEHYQTMLAHAQLYGRAGGNAVAEKGANAHLTAYLLGGARLLQITGKAAMLPALFKGWQLERLIDEHFLPRWPKAWTHHIWRVSHWIGGIPSILLQIAESGQNTMISRSLVDKVLQSSSERLLAQRSGLLKPYKSELLQQLFKAAYRLRHDPDIGEIGGVVHILWVFHAVNKPYVASNALFDSAKKHLQREPFMEKVPYCLDFDIVQLARTAAPNEAARLDLAPRAERFRRDIAVFLTSDEQIGYTLHKLPGALATMHECAMIQGLSEVPELGIDVIDVIHDAYWL